MKTSTVSAPPPAMLGRMVPVHQRLELSLIFMVAIAFGEVVLTSRGMALVSDLLVPFANGLTCTLLWVSPSLQTRSLVRSLIVFVVWTVVSLSISGQVENLMAPSPAHHEVSAP